jgi:hypothetical protein
MSLVVTLSTPELAICNILGNMRHLVNRAGKTVDRQKGNQSALDIDIDGVIAEYVFCKHWNIFFDLSSEARSGSFDCLLNNKRIDIKSTRYATGKLIKTLKPNPDIDIYVLAIINGNTVTFPGWITSNAFIQEENIMNLSNKGDCYAVEQSGLTPWRE